MCREHQPSETGGHQFQLLLVGKQDVTLSMTLDRYESEIDPRAPKMCGMTFTRG